MWGLIGSNVLLRRFGYCAICNYGATSRAMSSCVQIQSGAISKRYEQPIDIARELFAYLDEKSVEFVVMGDPERLLESDLDICIRDYRQGKGLLINFCEGRGLEILGFHHHATGIRYDLRSESGVILHGPDIVVFPTMRGRAPVSLDDAISRRVGNFPHPKDAFILYLIKKIDKGDITPEHGQYLSRLWSEDPDGACESISRVWGCDETQLLFDAANVGPWSIIRPNMARLRKTMGRFDLKHFIWDIQRLLARLLHPPGLYVSTKADIADKTVFRRVSHVEGRFERLKAWPKVLRNHLVVGSKSKIFIDSDNPESAILDCLAERTRWRLKLSVDYDCF